MVEVGLVMTVLPEGFARGGYRHLMIQETRAGAATSAGGRVHYVGPWLSGRRKRPVTLAALVFRGRKPKAVCLTGAPPLGLVIKAASPWGSGGPVQLGELPSGMECSQLLRLAALDPFGDSRCVGRSGVSVHYSLRWCRGSRGGELPGAQRGPGGGGPPLGS